MVIIHANEMRILTVATRTIPVSSAGSDSPDQQPGHPAGEREVQRRDDSSGSSFVTSAYSRPRSVRMQIVTTRIVAST